MTNKTKTSFEIPEDVQEQADNIIREGVRALNNGFKRFAENVEQFNKNHEAVRERIKNGARRTSGRIV